MIFTLDAETFFSDKFSLSKLTTESYCRDERFEVHGWALRWPDGRVEWLTHAQALQVFPTIDWSQAYVLCHHAQYDLFILNHIYGIRPKAILDILSMARLLLGNHLSVSLDSVRKHFGMPAKRTPYHLFKNKHWLELDDATRQLIADGACDEVQSIWGIFQLLAKSFPIEEYKVVDTTVRLFTEPVLQGDINLLGKVWSDEAKRKRNILAELQITAEDLQSADKFKELLEAEGVEIEYKDGKNGLIPCFAKTDEFMKNLLEDSNVVVRSLVEARLDVRSTLEQTRAERLGFMASRGPMPVYLRYSGAHTTRWSGGDGVNWQNFPRGGGIRNAIMAPQGQLIATIDLSQIECRILNYVAGQWDVIDNFALGKDPYVGIASQFYNREITVADKAERGTGKQAELSCGYQSGAVTFQKTAKLGVYGPPVELSLETAQKFVNIYRSTHPHVVQFWKDASRMLARLAGGPAVEWGPVTIRDRCIWLPNGAPIIYDTLEYSPEWESWRVKKRNGWTKLYGGKLTENLIQALARVVFSQALIRIVDAGFKVVNLEHDKIAVLVKDDNDKYAAFEWLKAEMVKEPSWLPGIPLACEGELDERYEPLK